MRSRRKTADQDVVRITDAPVNVSADVSSRQRRYLISMAVRTVCFIGAVISFNAGLKWLCWVLFVGALVLPVVAVVIANAASPRLPEDVTGPGFDPDHGYKELE
jgi:hypothetical protein